MKCLLNFGKISCAVIALAISGCAYFPHLKDDTTNTAAPDPFREHLRKGYIELAESEYAQNDREDAGHYRYKAYAQTHDLTVTPEGLGTRNIPTANINELAEAYNFLMTAFAKGMKEKAPELAATAQLKYDCWVEQQEENFQPDDIANCRKAFRVAEDQLEAIIKEMEKPAEVVMPQPYMVFFDWDSSKLGQPAKEVLKRVAEEVKFFKPSKIVIAGHADASGAEGYNQKLSEKRAYEVAGEMASEGVNADILMIRALGEKEPRVKTADGVKEPQNRFAEIIFQK